MKLTALICTHNRTELLKSCLYSIDAAIKPADIELSVLIIANACLDSTVSDVIEYKKKKPSFELSIYEESAPGKSYALNHGIKLIKDDYVCLIDDDQKVDISYFEEVVNSIKNYPGFDIFCGSIFPDWCGDEPDWLRSEGKYKIYPPPIPIFNLGNTPLTIPGESSSLPGGGHTIVHRKVFNQIGEFSTVLGPKGHDLIGSEDTDFFQRCIENGKQIKYIPSIKQLHYVDNDRLTLHYLIIKSFQRNRSITKFRHPNRVKPHAYLFRKLFGNMLNIIFTLKENKRRFYIMRLFSTLGEIIGMLEK